MFLIGAVKYWLLELFLEQKLISYNGHEIKS